MRSKLLLGGLLASVVVLPVFAQQAPAPTTPPAPAVRETTPPAPPAATPAQPAATPAPAPAATPAPRAQTTTTTPIAMTGQWRASKLVGLNVYNDQNERLGDINEILLDQSGKVHGVIIGVGGFLGMGEREIMVTMDKLRFVNEPYRATTTTTTPPTTTTTTPATTAAGDRTVTTTTSDRVATTTTTRPARAATEKWYPDHAILSGVTKESVRAMTEWKYN